MRRNFHGTKPTLMTDLRGYQRISPMSKAITNTLRTGLLLLVFAMAANTQAMLKTDNFVLLDHNGKAHELYYESDATAIVLISQRNDCEALTHSIPDYRSLTADYVERGVRFFMLNSHDARSSIADLARAWDLDIPILHDSAQIIGRSLNFQMTGEVLLIDPRTWQVIFRGSAESRGLRMQIDSLIKGEESLFLSDAEQQTARGCEINYKSKSEVVSYTNDIVPILESRCMACHVEGGIGPWAMSEYNMIKGFAPMMREVIRVKRMPPWHADPELGHWKNDAGMSDEDTRTLINWIEAGAQRGKGPDPLLAKRANSVEWPLGEPDLVLDAPTYEVPASGVVDYQFPVIANPLNHDVWVEAASVRPGNTKVVHHVLMGSAEQAPEEDDQESVFQNYIMGYAPGNESARMPEGTGVFVPAGGVYQLQIHYTPMGIATKDTTKIALYFADKPPANFLRQHVVLNPRLKIPAHDEAFEVAAYFEFWDDAVIHSLVPHSHYRGKSSTFELEYPDGSKEMILSVPNYNFDWQRTYSFTEPKEVPKGSRIIHRTVYDNSAKNRSNPDPERVVPWGLQSQDEMLYGSVSFSWTNETAETPIHSNLRADAGQFIGFVDKNMDGKASKDELPSRMRESLGWFKWWFVDTNFDGGLDLDEMEAMFSR